jgi:DNA helicase-4
VQAHDKTRQGAVVTRLYRDPSDVVDDCEASLADIAAKLPIGKRASVFLLARYRFQEPDRLSTWRSRFRSLDITFKTAHSSKGLQADFVVVLNLSAGRYGFPSEITDDPLLQLVMPEPEVFPNAEERRLFYVAMTRARHRVYLIGASYAPSAFLRELRGDSDIDTAAFSEPPGALRVAEPPPPEYGRD